MRARSLLMASIVTGALIASAPPANAGATVVRGAQVIVGSGSCFDPSAVFSTVMTGGLIGCWWVDTFDVVGETPSGAIRASGTERFSGCLDANLDGMCGSGDPTGTFGTTYTFTGQFDAAGAEIHGRCNHPIGDGTGDFEGASGVINFTDDVVTGISYYTGPVRVA